MGVRIGRENVGKLLLKAEGCWVLISSGICSLGRIFVQLATVVVENHLDVCLSAVRGKCAIRITQAAGALETGSGEGCVERETS